MGQSLHALRDGFGRVARAPWLVLGMTGVTLLIALPLSIALRGMIEAHLGASLAADGAASSAGYDWWREFQAQATGLGTTFVPSIAGFGAVLANLSNLLDNEPMAATIAGATGAWLLVWTFLSGGVIDRLARDRRTRAHGFFGACGVHFWRFLRIGLFAWLIYAFLFGWVHGWIFEDVYDGLTRDLSVERTAFTIRLGGYLVFGGLLAFFNLVFDYARIRTVVEDRRSALASIAAAARFMRRYPLRVASLYALNSGAFLLLIALYGALAPGAPGAGARMWVALLLGQLYILGRHFLKLLFYASETALFQASLAHAGYTASPSPVWPDSPAAESIGNADPMGAR